jgi:hypothetical protein
MPRRGRVRAGPTAHVSHQTRICAVSRREISSKARATKSAVRVAGDNEGLVLQHLCS